MILKPDALKPPGEPPEGTPGFVGTILVLDDDHDVRRITARVLQAAGFHVLEASSGAEALLGSAQYRGAIDLLLTNVQLPRISGTRLASRLQLTRPAMRVVVMSGADYESVVVDHGDFPRERFLRKPFTSASLTRTVRRALAGI